MSAKQRDKDATLRKVTEAAGRQFRRHGYAGVGVAGVAKAAGLTTGALYDHFGSKDGAFTAALTAGLDEVIAALPRFQADHGDAWLAAFSAYYLGDAHRCDGERLCVMTALSPDVARGGPELKAVYEQKMREIAQRVAAGLPQTEAAERERRAWRILSLLIGALTIARAMSDAALADQIAEIAKLAAEEVRED